MADTFNEILEYYIEKRVQYKLKEALYEVSNALEKRLHNMKLTPLQYGDLEKLIQQLREMV